MPMVRVSLGKVTRRRPKRFAAHRPNSTRLDMHEALQLSTDRGQMPFSSQGVQHGQVTQSDRDCHQFG